MRLHFLLGAVSCAILLGALAQDAAKAPGKPDEQPKQQKPNEEKPKQDKPKQQKPKEDPNAPGQPWADMQYGSIISATFETRPGGGQFANKGVAIQLGTPEHRGAVIFDTDLCRYSSAWTGEFLNLHNVAFDGAHGPMPSPRGDILWAVKGQRPGASLSEDFADPRPTAAPYGPLPREQWPRYKGLYRNGERVIVKYSIGDCDILETPSLGEGEKPVIIRDLRIGPAKEPINILVAEDDADPQPSTQPTTEPTPQPLHAAVLGDRQAKLKTVNGLTYLAVPAHTKPIQLSIAVIRGKGQKTSHEAPNNLEQLCKGGPAQWPKTVTTQPVLGTGDGAYVVDTLSVPEDNPYKSWMRFGGFDFFSDGRAAICTWSGDVWVVSGITEKLDKPLTWKRYAAGLFQTLGLKIVDDKVYVLGRDQITRLHDLNNDGEADFYECFNNDQMAAPSFHEFCFDLQADSHGDFYFAKAGAVNPGGRGWQRTTPHNGIVAKVSKDGSRFEVYATGVRAPNGMSVGPHDEITVSDNEGTWTPTCRLSFVHHGSFLGVTDLAHFDPKPTNYGNPIFWLPHGDVDNSSGGAVWITSDTWGPFRDRLVHLSYGTCSMFLVLNEQIGDVAQGGAVKFKDLSFDSGICRARMNPHDGQVYVVGLKGWQTTAAKDACFQRVRYTGKPVYMPTSLHVKDGAIELSFTQPLDPDTAGDVDSYDISQWNYIWSNDYGSPEVDVHDPEKKQHDPVKVEAAFVSPDHKTVTLKIPDVRPVMQMKISFKLEAQDGTPVEYDIYNTINTVPGYKPRPKPTTAPIVAATTQASAAATK
jgi:hypothetical protein